MGMRRKADVVFRLHCRDLRGSERRRHVCPREQDLRFALAHARGQARKQPLLSRQVCRSSTASPYYHEQPGFTI